MQQGAQGRRELHQGAGEHEGTGAHTRVQGTTRGCRMVKGK